MGVVVEPVSSPIHHRSAMATGSVHRSFRGRKVRLLVTLGESAGQILQRPCDGYFLPGRLRCRPVVDYLARADQDEAVVVSQDRIRANR